MAEIDLDGLADLLGDVGRRAEEQVVGREPLEAGGFLPFHLPLAAGERRVHDGEIGIAAAAGGAGNGGGLLGREGRDAGRAVEALAALDHSRPGPAPDAVGAWPEEIGEDAGLLLRLGRHREVAHEKALAALGGPVVCVEHCVGRHRREFVP